MDFDGVLLSPREKLILLSLRFRKRRKGNIYASPLNKLQEYGLIAENHMPHRGPEGEAIPDGTYSLTDRAKRYRIYIRRQRLRSYLTPVIVAFLTSIAANLLKELWLPVLLHWIQGLF